MLDTELWFSPRCRRLFARQRRAIVAATHFLQVHVAQVRHVLVSFEAVVLAIFGYVWA
jgi:hypothetical protein